MNRVSTLVWYGKTDAGWRRFPVVRSSNGKIKTGVVMVDGKEVSCSKGSFQIRSYEGSKTIYRSVGTSAAEAEMALRKARVGARVKEDASAVGIRVVSDAQRVAVRTAIPRFIQRTVDGQSPVAAEVYALALRDLMELSPLDFVDEISAEHMLRFHAALRRKGNSDRTVANKHKNVCSFFRWAGVDTKGFRVPKFEKKLANVYGMDDVDRLLAIDLDPYWRMTLQLLRQTGLREQEAVYLQWGDLNLGAKVLRVRSKPVLGFTIKDKEERDIPLPDGLVDELKIWREAHPSALFVVGTKNDKPNHKLLRGLKRLIHNAGLNCGTCEGCKERNECRKWNLHSFRRTYATTLSRAGIDVKTIQRFLGHSDVETTMGYLAAMKTADAQPLISAVKW